MNVSDIEWKNITRKYLGNIWVKNETAVSEMMIKQQKRLPISVADARAQVMQLKKQSNQP